MSRGIDHIVHAVRDLDAAAEFYRGLGFTVGARNRHPWGTHNHIVQFPSTFIELVTLAEPDKLGDDDFSRLFGAYHRDFLARGEGLSLLILESKDAAADAAAFKAGGIALSDVLRFEREGKRPDGSTVKVAFSLAYAENRAAPDHHFVVCQQHYPENFWNPAFQTHANSVRRVTGVVLVADEPARHRDFMLAFAGAEQAQDDADGFSIDTSRGRISATTPAAFARNFGTPAPDTGRGARLACLRFGFSDPAAAANALRKTGHAKTLGEGFVIGPSHAMGATLVFEPEGTPSR